MARWGNGASLAFVAVSVVVALSTHADLVRAQTAPVPTSGVVGSHPVGIASPTPEAAGALPPALLEALTALDQRVAGLERGQVPPPWAAMLKSELDTRIERVMEIQERLAARIETPLPRLDEPIILLTVAASAAVLGFGIGRSLQRRRDRRAGRFRL